MPTRFRSFISICLVSGVVALLALPVSAAPSDPTRLGFCGGDDWEPDVAADGAGHVYVVWAHFAGAGGCTPSDTDHNRRTFIQVSDDDGKTWGDPHLVADTVNGVDYPAQIDTTVTVS